MLAFAMSFIMLIAWRVFFVKAPPPEPKKPPVASSAPAKSGAVPSTSAAPAPGAANPPPALLPVAQGTSVQDLVVENKLYRVTFSTQGAVVKSWVIKGYPKGDQLDLVDSHASEKLGFPMSLTLPDATLTAHLNQAIYVAEATKPVAGHDPEKLSGPNFAPPLSLTFTFSDGKVQAKKTFSFGDGYIIKLEV